MPFLTVQAPDSAASARVVSPEGMGFSLQDLRSAKMWSAPAKSKMGVARTRHGFRHRFRRQRAFEADVCASFLASAEAVALGVLVNDAPVATVDF